MQNSSARHTNLNAVSKAQNGDIGTISEVNQLLRRELEKHSGFKRQLNKQTDVYGRVWRVTFPTTGRGAVIQYFNDDAPREYKLDLPNGVAKRLVEVAESHDHAAPGDHIYDLILYYDIPFVSVAVD